MVHINNPMKTDLKFIKDISSNPKWYNLNTSIVHMIDREADYISYGDASLEAAGGFAHRNFWWHIEWPDEMKALI